MQSKKRSFPSVIPKRLMTRNLRRIRGTLLMSSCLEAILGEGLLIIQGFEKLRNGNILLRKNRLKLCTHLYDLWYWLFTFVGVVHIVSPISLVRKQLHMIVISHGRKQIGDVGALKRIQMVSLYNLFTYVKGRLYILVRVHYSILNTS